MERTISATPRHSEDELKQLFTKTLKLSSLWYAYEMLKDDSLNMLVNIQMFSIT